MANDPDLEFALSGGKLGAPRGATINLRSNAEIYGWSRELIAAMEYASDEMLADLERAEVDHYSADMIAVTADWRETRRATQARVDAARARILAAASLSNQVRAAARARALVSAN